MCLKRAQEAVGGYWCCWQEMLKADEAADGRILRLLRCACRQVERDVDADAVVVSLTMLKRRAELSVGVRRYVSVRREKYS